MNKGKGSIEVGNFIVLWMICFLAKQCVEKRLSGRFRTPAPRLNCDKHCVELLELFGIVEAHVPAMICFAVQVENTEALGPSLHARRRFLAPPHLIRVDVLHSGVQIESIKNE